MSAVAIYVLTYYGLCVCLSVCLSVYLCVLVTMMSPAKTTQPVKIQFEQQAQVGLRNHAHIR